MITIRLEEDTHSLEEGTDITKQLWTMSLMASLNRKGGETLTSDPRGPDLPILGPFDRKILTFTVPLGSNNVIL